jgi:hypothetical protein
MCIRDRVYLASEQPKINKPFQSLLIEQNATFDIHTMPKNDLKQLRKDIEGYNFVFIDSINHLGIEAEQLEELRKSMPKTSFVGIMQSTKGGDFKGSQEFLHNADIKIEMEKPYAKQTKSRYSNFQSEILTFKSV